MKGRVRLAAERGLRIQGIVDGDGFNLAAPDAAFHQAPAPGESWVWPAWCLDNLLAQATWPERWGAPPDWPSELAKYAPEAAWGQLSREIQLRLPGEGQAHSLATFLKPTQHAWRDPTAIQGALADWLAGEQLGQHFQRLVAEHREACGRSLEEAHARTNGKWLWTHFAPWKAPGRPTPQQALSTWREAVRDAGGSPEVKAWWGRMRAAF